MYKEHMYLSNELTEHEVLSGAFMLDHYSFPLLLFLHFHLSPSLFIYSTLASSLSLSQTPTHLYFSHSLCIRPSGVKRGGRLGVLPLSRPSCTIPVRLLPGPPTPQGANPPSHRRVMKKQYYGRAGRQAGTAPVLKSSTDKVT